MLTYSEKKALEIFLSDFDREKSFKELCSDIEIEDFNHVTIWEGLESMSAIDISTLIHEVQQALSETITNTMLLLTK